LNAGIKSRASSPPPNRHIPGLDGIRGLAILLVMVFHMTVIEGGPLLDRLWIGAANVGWAGVDLFFVLSGFLITGILFDSKGSDGYFRNFYARRVLRIFPLYYSVVFVCLVILPLIDHPRIRSQGAVPGDEIWYWTYLSNFSIAHHHQFRHAILDISWSLAIEEQYYLVWPLVVLFLSRRALIRVCVGLIGAAVVFRCALLLADVHPVAIYVITPSRMDALALGSLLALLDRGEGGLRAWTGFARRGLAATGVAFAGILLWQRGPANYSPVMQAVGYTTAALFFGALLVLVVGSPAGSAIPRMFEGRFFRTLGRFSYALYLCHLPVRSSFRGVIFPPDRFFTVFGSKLPALLVFYLLAMSASLLLAWLSWHACEKHFLKLKRFFR